MARSPRKIMMKRLILGGGRGSAEPAVRDGSGAEGSSVADSSSADSSESDSSSSGAESSSEVPESSVTNSPMDLLLYGFAASAFSRSITLGGRGDLPKRRLDF